MKIVLSKTAEELGKKAADSAAEALNKVIEEKGSARLLLSTGASQFTTISELVKKDVDWSKVEMFHLDEYVGLPESHIASFRKYLKERFVSHVDIKEAYFVNGEGDVEENIKKLTEEIRRAPIDVALIGIGENAHIAFNDPPADFDTKEAYIKVNLDNKCKMQQVGEGWFDTKNDVPDQAITMTVYQIMQSKKIISCVPHKVKAEAIKNTLENDLNNEIPATMLKQHSDWTLFVDENSASLIDVEKYN
ncbi:glucosamine-6-phosphate deaminase [Clostridiisalibacter paucivorans]|uniref:glucosamine-6-phosphate deaminase n=1 Tax=Clostridiisalibacter paucivorans TaxID=408753 RepID=UPI00047E13B7|nr:glucosamine-6-phosphate deaminase [Clostridiisalibacter paucivorans]